MVHYVFVKLLEDMVYSLGWWVVESIGVLADLEFNVSVNTLCQPGYTPDNER